MIFNMVVDAVICHWVTVVNLEEEGTGGLGMTIIDMAAYFYAEDGLVAPTQPERLNREFDVLTSLFYRVGLRTNTSKTVDMVCQLCHAPCGMSEEAYAQRTKWKGPTFWDRHRRRMECPECGVEVTAGFLLTHCQSHNGVGREDPGGGETPPPPPPREAQNYWVSFPKHLSRLR